VRPRARIGGDVRAASGRRHGTELPGGTDGDLVDAGICVAVLGATRSRHGRGGCPVRPPITPAPRPPRSARTPRHQVTAPSAWPEGPHARPALPSPPRQADWPCARTPSPPGSRLRQEPVSASSDKAWPFDANLWECCATGACPPTATRCRRWPAARSTGACLGWGWTVPGGWIWQLPARNGARRGEVAGRWRVLVATIGARAGAAGRSSAAAGCGAGRQRTSLPRRSWRCRPGSPAGCWRTLTGRSLLAWSRSWAACRPRMGRCAGRCPGCGRRA
jgi:hypothetical protein